MLFIIQWLLWTNKNHGDMSVFGDRIEKTFAKILGGENVLVFYVCNHMFAMVDISDSDLINVKCQTERIIDLREHYEWADRPSHMNGKY